jgi:hypothetical protein
MRSFAAPGYDFIHFVGYGWQAESAFSFAAIHANLSFGMPIFLHIFYKKHI